MAVIKGRHRSKSPISGTRNKNKQKTHVLKLPDLKEEYINAMLSYTCMLDNKVESTEKDEVSDPTSNLFTNGFYSVTFSIISLFNIKALQ